jgi:hypothetical protein
MNDAQGQTLPPQVTFKQLEAMLKDPNVPEALLRRYFVGDKQQARPFSPAVTVDPDLVIMDETDALRVQGAMAMNWANAASRARRQAGFNLRKLTGSSLPVVVAEGDSWFQFPIVLDDVVDQLNDSYLIWCLSAAGDTLANMVFAEPEYGDGLAQKGPPKVLLFSGAGNDIVGEVDGVSVLASVVKRFDPALRPQDYIDTDGFRGRLAFVEDAYRTLFEQVDSRFEGRVKVLCHGYDRAIPHGAPGDPRNPFWAAADGWIAAPLRSRGIHDHGLQRRIVALMIDALNDLLKRLCGGNNPGGAFPRAYHADLRGTLPKPSDWADELHPTNEGFAKVARKLAPLLQQLV